MAKSSAASAASPSRPPATATQAVADAAPAESLAAAVQADTTGEQAKDQAEAGRAIVAAVVAEVSKDPTTPVFVPPRVAVGDVVFYRELLNGAEPASLLHLPAIVRHVGPGDALDLTVFSPHGTFTHNNVSHANLSRTWMNTLAWLSRDGYERANPFNANRRFHTPASSPKSDLYTKVLPDVKVGAFVLYRLYVGPVGSYFTANAPPSDLASRVYPAVVLDVTHGGALLLAVFTPAGMVAAGPALYSKDHPNCWCERLPFSPLGTIVPYRTVTAAADPANDDAKLYPAVVREVTPDFGVCLTVFTDLGFIDSGPVVLSEVTAESFPAA